MERSQMEKKLTGSGAYLALCDVNMKEGEEESPVEVQILALSKIEDRLMIVPFKDVEKLAEAAEAAFFAAAYLEQYFLGDYEKDAKSQLARATSTQIREDLKALSCLKIWRECMASFKDTITEKNAELSDPIKNILDVFTTSEVRQGWANPLVCSQSVALSRRLKEEMMRPFKEDTLAFFKNLGSVDEVIEKIRKSVNISEDQLEKLRKEMESIPEGEGGTFNAGGISDLLLEEQTPSSPHVEDKEDS
jgi:hypothetical protein